MKIQGAFFVVSLFGIVMLLIGFSDIKETIGCATLSVVSVLFGIAKILEDRLPIKK